MTQSWSTTTSWSEVCKRASGRRQYNALRRDQMLIRRYEIVNYLIQNRVTIDHGTQSMLARRFGVSRATISRDMTAIYELMLPCPTCSRLRRVS